MKVEKTTGIDYVRRMTGTTAIYCPNCNESVKDTKDIICAACNYRFQTYEPGDE